jgi:predicted DCC family thiol-disulfide oxidoreductase YuxK
MGSPGTVGSTADIILFDGLCNLCSGSVQFIIKRDRKDSFQFASLQSSFGQNQLAKFNLDRNSFHSIILIRGDRFFQKSDAALEISKRLGSGWPLLYGLKIIPRFIRDSIYSWISNNRYRFFGKKTECWIPDSNTKDRFIE